MLQRTGLLHTPTSCIRLKFTWFEVLCSLGNETDQASLCNLVSALNPQPSNPLPDVDTSAEAIYPEPAKQPLSLQNAEHQSFTQNVEGVEAISRVYPLAGTTRAPHHDWLKRQMKSLLMDVNRI